MRGPSQKMLGPFGIIHIEAAQEPSYKLNFAMQVFLGETDTPPPGTRRFKLIIPKQPGVIDLSHLPPQGRINRDTFAADAKKYYILRHSHIEVPPDTQKWT